MKTGKEVFEAYNKLDVIEKIKFTRSLNIQKREEIFALENKRLEIAGDLEDCGINKEWIVKNILLLQ